MVVAPGETVEAVISNDLFATVALLSIDILLGWGGDRLCILSWTGDETDLPCCPTILGTLLFLGGGPGGGGGMLPRLCESPLTAPGGIGPLGSELSLGGGPGGGGGILDSESPLTEPGACWSGARSWGDSEFALRPIPMPTCIAALLALWVRLAAAGDPIAIGDVSRLVGGGPGGGGGMLLGATCALGRRVGGPREPFLGPTIGLVGAPISGDGYEVCWSPDGAYPWVVIPAPAGGE